MCVGRETPGHWARSRSQWSDESRGGGQRMGVGEQNGQLLHSFSVCGNNRDDASDWIILGLLIG